MRCIIGSKGSEMLRRDRHEICDLRFPANLLITSPDWLKLSIGFRFSYLDVIGIVFYGNSIGKSCLFIKWNLEENEWMVNCVRRDGCVCFSAGFQTVRWEIVSGVRCAHNLRDFSHLRTGWESGEKVSYGQTIPSQVRGLLQPLREAYPELSHARR